MTKQDRTILDRTATKPSHQRPSNHRVRGPAPRKPSPVLGRPGPRDGVRALFSRGTRSKSSGPPSIWWFPGCPPSPPGPGARVPARVSLVHRDIHSSRGGFRHRHRCLSRRTHSPNLSRIHHLNTQEILRASFWSESSLFRPYAEYSAEFWLFRCHTSVKELYRFEPSCLCCL